MLDMRVQAAKQALKAGSNQPQAQQDGQAKDARKPGALRFTCRQDAYFEDPVVLACSLQPCSHHRCSSLSSAMARAEGNACIPGVVGPLDAHEGDLQDGDVYMNGTLSSPECGIVLGLNATTTHVEEHYAKAINYTLMVTAVSFLQARLPSCARIGMPQGVCDSSPNYLAPPDVCATTHFRTCLLQA